MDGSLLGVQVDIWELEWKSEAANDNDAGPLPQMSGGAQMGLRHPAGGTRKNEGRGDTEHP